MRTRVALPAEMSACVDGGEHLEGLAQPWIVAENPAAATDRADQPANASSLVILKLREGARSQLDAGPAAPQDDTTPGKQGAPSGASDRQPHSASAQGAPSPEAPAQPPTTQALAGTPCQRHPATAPSTSLIGVEQLDWASRVEQVPPLAPEFLPPWHSAWRRGE